MKSKRKHGSGSIWELKHKLEAKNTRFKVKKESQKEKWRCTDWEQSRVPRHHTLIALNVSTKKGCVTHPWINIYMASGDQRELKGIPSLSLLMLGTIVAILFVDITNNHLTNLAVLAKWYYAFFRLFINSRK